MLFGISGRKGSGKSVAAQVLLKQGFKKASFAAGLKEYVGKLYGWTEEELATQDGKEEILKDPVYWNENAVEKLNEIIGINLVFDGKEMQFPTRRAALQHIGTDVLRDYDEDFHIKEFVKRFKDGNYVCDDIRFQNELGTVEGIGGVCCFIVRPYACDYSNHSSEISVRRQDFKHVIMNDGSLISLEFEIQDLLNSMFEKPDVFYKPCVENAYWAGFLLGTGNFEKTLHGKLCFVADHPNADLIDKFNSFLCGYKNTVVCIENPFVIDDLKLWDVSECQKTLKVPDCVKTNNALYQSWHSGLIAGSTDFHDGKIEPISQKAKAVIQFMAGLPDTLEGN